MVTFEKIGIDSLLIYINNAFRDDAKLCNTYHIHPGSYHDCAVDTYNRIIETVHTYEGSVIYGIKSNGEKIGFVVMIPPSVLYSFGLNISFRTEEIKQELINFVSSSLLSATVLLFEKNTRAINFFKRHNYKEKGQVFHIDGKIKLLQLC